MHFWYYGLDYSTLVGKVIRKLLKNLTLTLIKILELDYYLKPEPITWISEENRI